MLILLEHRDVRSTASAEALFAGNYPRLQSIKAKYDPNLMFHSWFPIQPASTTQQKNVLGTLKEGQIVATQFIERIYDDLYA
jgi:hypothetical protein